jgi:hypothetical protein
MSSADVSGVSREVPQWTIKADMSEGIIYINNKPHKAVYNEEEPDFKGEALSAESLAQLFNNLLVDPKFQSHRITRLGGEIKIGKVSLVPLDERIATAAQQIRRPTTTAPAAPGKRAMTPPKTPAPQPPAKKARLEETEEGPPKKVRFAGVPEETEELSEKDAETNEKLEQAEKTGNISTIETVVHKAKITNINPFLAILSRIMLLVATKWPQKLDKIFSDEQKEEIFAKLEARKDTEMLSKLKGAIKIDYPKKFLQAASKHEVEACEKLAKHEASFDADTVKKAFEYAEGSTKLTALLVRVMDSSSSLARRNAMKDVVRDFLSERITTSNWGMVRSFLERIPLEEGDKVPYVLNGALNDLMEKLPPDSHDRSMLLDAINKYPRLARAVKT